MDAGRIAIAPTDKPLEGGKEEMNTFRADVKKLMGQAAEPSVTVAPSVKSATPSDAAANEKAIWDFFADKGLNACAVAGLMGNLFAESGLNPCNLQNSYEKKLNYSDATYTAAVDKGTYKSFVSDKAGYNVSRITRQSAFVEQEETSRRARE